MEKSKIEDLKAAIYWIAVNYQQNFYEISSDWNRYNPDEHLYLKNYIGYAIYGPPEYEEVCGDEEDGSYVYKEKGAMDVIEKIYNKIVEHGTQLTEEKEVLCSILYTCIYDESSLATCDEYKIQELIYIRPLFKVQKGIKKKDFTDLQVWYVDTEGRVYRNWKDYLTNNNLPTCTMIAPKHGIYQANLREVWSDTMSPVWVETHNNHTIKKITNAVDVASTLVNFGCVGIGIAAIFNPISAPVAIAGAVGGAVSGVWGGGRAIGELVDRSTHDESISPINKHAIPAWLGVAGSTLGLAASSGSALLSRAIRTGTSVGKGAQIAHDAILISNLFVNSVGVGYNSVSMVQKYRETGEVSARDVFFLTAHVLFICNSAVKIRLASEIIRSDQNQILKDYEESLRSNRHKKEFRRLVRNTGSQITDEVHRNEQIIRSLTKISNRDEFFATMAQNRKLFASTNTQLSFADGHVQVNGVTLINPSTFASMPKDSIVSLVNQASGTTIQSGIQANPSTSSGNTFISSNALKVGVSALRDFYVQKSVSSTMPPESQTSEYRSIISDIQNIPEQSKIMQLLLDSGLCIARRVMSQGSYSEGEALSDATNFIWQVIKCNFASSLPGISMLEERYHFAVVRIVQATHDYIKANCGEWVSAFRKYMDTFGNRNEENPTNSGNTEAAASQQRSRDAHIKYNDMILLDPGEVMSLQEEVTTMLVQEAINATGSKFNDPGSLPKELARMCEAELNDFFSVHPIELKFKLTELAEELKGILVDLKEFRRRDIIFYKLLVITVNIAQKVVGMEPLTKDVIIDVMKCLWVFVNLNFSQTVPDTNMFHSEYEGFIMNIIIALYRYQIAEPDKWLRAFHEYRCKYCEQ